MYGARWLSSFQQEANVDLSKLSMGQKIFAVAGLVYFISSFLAWYTYSFTGIVDVSANAWDIGFLWGSLWALLFIIGAVLLVLPGVRGRCSEASGDRLPPPRRTGDAGTL